MGSPISGTRITLQSHESCRVRIEIYLRVRMWQRPAGRIQVIYVVGAVLGSRIESMHLADILYSNCEVVIQPLRRELIQCEPMPLRENRDRSVLRVRNEIGKQHRLSPL